MAVQIFSSLIVFSQFLITRFVVYMNRFKIYATKNPHNKRRTKMKGFYSGYSYFGYIPSLKKYLQFASESDYREAFQEMEEREDE